MIELTPLDVRSKKGDFRRGLRGYETPQVDDFLDIVADRLEALVRDNLALNERVVRLEQQLAQYKGQERALTDTLLSAQAMREQIRGEAAREGEELRKAAEREVERLRTEAERLASIEEETLRTVRVRRQAFLAGYRAFLDKEMNELAACERAAEAEAANTREAVIDRKPAETSLRPPAPTDAVAPLSTQDEPRGASNDDLDARLGAMLSEWQPQWKPDAEAAELLLSPDDFPAHQQSDADTPDHELELLDALEPLDEHGQLDELEPIEDLEPDEELDELAELEALIASASQEDAPAPSMHPAEPAAQSPRPPFSVGSDTEIDALADRMFAEPGEGFDVEAVIDDVEHEDDAPFVLSDEQDDETLEDLEESELWLDGDESVEAESLLNDVEPFNPFAPLSDQHTHEAPSDNGASPANSSDEIASDVEPEDSSELEASSSSKEPDGTSHEEPVAEASSESVSSESEEGEPTDHRAEFDASADALFDGFDEPTPSWSHNGSVQSDPVSHHGPSEADIQAAFGDHDPGVDGLLDIRGFTTESGQANGDEEDGEFDSNFGLTLRPFFGEGDSRAEDLDRDGSANDNTRDFFSVPRDEE